MQTYFYLLAHTHFFYLFTIKGVKEILNNYVNAKHYPLYLEKEFKITEKDIKICEYLYKIANDFIVDFEKKQKCFSCFKYFNLSYKKAKLQVKNYKKMLQIKYERLYYLKGEYKKYSFYKMNRQPTNKKLEN
ncbi:hypothetical protein GVAV_002086 [Gurleya vavrai]